MNRRKNRCRKCRFLLRLPICCARSVPRWKRRCRRKWRRRMHRYRRPRHDAGTSVVRMPIFRRRFDRVFLLFISFTKGCIMRRAFLQSLASVFSLSALSPAVASAAPASERIKVVYHLSEGIDQATRAMANIRNHLRAAPGTKIVVVGLGDGIAFLLKGAKEREVEFRVGGNTLAAHKVPTDLVLPDAAIVPAGVAEIARLQAQESYVYIRP